jgi:hypothetical protein
MIQDFLKWAKTPNWQNLNLYQIQGRIDEKRVEFVHLSLFSGDQSV